MTRVRLVVEVEISDGVALEQHNREKAIEYHGDPHWTPEDPVDAVASGLIKFNHPESIGLRVLAVDGCIIGDPDCQTDIYKKG